VLPRGVEVGRHTYGYDAETFPIYTEGARVIVGAFCSIAPDARIHGGGEHVLTRVTPFPLNAMIFDHRDMGTRFAVGNAGVFFTLNGTNWERLVSTTVCRCEVSTTAVTPWS
jgi:hypothetical protein